MFGDVLEFFKNTLNAYFKQRFGITDELVEFIEQIDLNGSIPFVQGKITPLLVNLEEEKIIRQANRYEEVSNGKMQECMPPVRLNLYIIFVSHNENYKNSLNYISYIVEFFQAHRYFKRDKYPGLPGDIDRLTIELETMPISQQNDLWSSLRSVILPHVYYKVGIITVEDKTQIYTPILPIKTIDYNSSLIPDKIS